MIDNPFELSSLNAVVAGGGAIGTALVKALVDEGHCENVIMLARRTPHGLPAGVVVEHVDATEPSSISEAAARVGNSLGKVHVLINTIGILHGDKLQPEKRLKELESEAFHRAMAVNALFLPMLAQGFSKTLRHDDPGILASLSARVGSIADNDMGGWYSYRASKAAHNMLLRTLSREWRISHRNVTVLALHPGTVASALSQPFVSPTYARRVLQPDECAAYLLQVLKERSTSDSGSFYDWRGEPIPW